MINVHFETLSSGMKAKLDTRYRTEDKNTPHSGKTPDEVYAGGLLDNTVGKVRPDYVKISR